MRGRSRRVRNEDPAGSATGGDCPRTGEAVRGHGLGLGAPVSGSYDQWAAARQAADLVATDLNRVSGLLEEVATLWRRAQLYGQQSSPIAPGSLQDAARNLADALRLLPDADCEEHPALAFAAVAQLAALESNAACSAAVTAERHLGDAGVWAAVEGALLQVGKRLWSLITCLAEIGEPRLAEGPAAARGALVTWGTPSLPAAGSGESCQALATQRAAIDALPEVELRRLLVLIGGIDPSALQLAAALYTETFCAVAEMKGSVAALRPLALAQPGTCPPGLGQ